MRTFRKNVSNRALVVDRTVITNGSHKFDATSKSAIELLRENVFCDDEESEGVRFIEFSSKIEEFDNYCYSLIFQPNLYIKMNMNMIYY